MINFQSMAPIRPLWTETDAVDNVATNREQPTMFSDIFQSMIDNVKETQETRNEKYYQLATGQLDNPAEATIAGTQAVIASELLVQMRDKALNAYSELMRISL